MFVSDLKLLSVKLYVGILNFLSGVLLSIPFFFFFFFELTYR